MRDQIMLKPIDYLRNALNGNNTEPSQPTIPESETGKLQQQQVQHQRKAALAQNKQAVLNTLSNPQMGTMQ